MSTSTTTQPISLGIYQIVLNTADGLLAGLRSGGGPETIGQGGGPIPLGVDLAWRPLEAQPEYVAHLAEADRLTVTIRLGPLYLHDRYSLNGRLLERRIAVENVSGDEVQLTGLRIGLRGVVIGSPEMCRFEAPANVVRPRLPLSLAAKQPLRKSCSPPGARAESHLPPPDPFFAPGAALRFNQGLADAPDMGPGLLIVHNPELKWSLLTWYVSRVEAATPWVSGDGETATLGFDLGLAGWLAPGAGLEGGTQYILLHHGDYPSALSAYRERLTQTGILPPVYEKIDRAQDWTGIYEVHPGQFGGFEGLAAALPKIRHMSFDTIYLMPVMAHRNKKNRPWDENWEGVGSPYAVHDFEALEPSLGGQAEFRELINTAHDLGMRVLTDLVLQGCSLESRYVAEHPDWFARDEQGRMVHSHGWNDTWSFDWANSEYQAYMLDWALRFLKEYNLDGFRVDAPHGKEPNWDRRVPYHASRTSLGVYSLLNRLREEMKTVKPSASLYCELFGPLWLHAHDISNDYHPWAMVWQLMNGSLKPYEFNEYLRDYWAVMPEGSPRVCFTETHDTRSWPFYALRGSAIEQVLLGILVMAGFVPMIWSGQEIGQGEFIRGLMLARRENRVLRRGTYLFNEVTVDDLGHYRRDQGHAPAESVYTLLRHDGQVAVFGVASLFPERVTYRFELPLDKLPLRRDRRYQLRDLISFRLWEEYGQMTWLGEELASFRLTPAMYTPYIFRFEEVPDAGGATQS